MADSWFPAEQLHSAQRPEQQDGPHAEQLGRAVLRDCHDHGDGDPLMNTTRDRSRGQGLVEFALVLPVFLVLIFGIIDGGRAVFSYNQVSQAARNVARVASTTCFT